MVSILTLINGYEEKKGLMLTLSFGFHTQDEDKISPDRF
ncbi:hypothetical protein S3E15_02245 [Bacillus mycoides]|uniref:Uncharacterized protein n=1 Tax=Bacillus mycoides TaxID=1405 RepID=A0AAP8BH28_BACMY|nr:hypothetical protein SZ39_2795 [Bacillus mycoides]OSX87068.1 hypothetical protein BTJ44_02745 [Bacillus mycoides]OSX95767.1 hypothetical protein S3E15_02245 [Bacillus mycoides]OSY16804.1 hypothetical protein BTJ48_00615 [Bacillus mycoides]